MKKGRLNNINSKRCFVLLLFLGALLLGAIIFSVFFRTDINRFSVYDNNDGWGDLSFRDGITRNSIKSFFKGLLSNDGKERDIFLQASPEDYTALLNNQRIRNAIELNTL